MITKKKYLLLSLYFFSVFSLSQTIDPNLISQLSPEQIEEFCGNAIEAKNINDELFLIMSTRAFKALDQKQIKKLLTSYKEIIHSDIPTIEKYGGGSARCMLTELF